MRRTIILGVATIVLVSGLLVASLGSSPAAQAVSWFDSMVTMHHGEHHMQRGEHCIDDEGDMVHRHSGMTGRMHDQMHRMMGGHHTDCPYDGSGDE